MLNLTINGRKAPRTPTFEANEGERVEFVVIGHGNFMHTFHLHGHRWVDGAVGTALRRRTGRDAERRVHVLR